MYARAGNGVPGLMVGFGAVATADLPAALNALADAIEAAARRVGGVTATAHRQSAP